MIALTRAEHTYGLNLTIGVTFDGEYATSTVSFEGEADETVRDRAHSADDMLARTQQRMRVSAERAYLEYRAALLKGWTVNLTEPINPDGRPSACDRWLLGKIIARCRTFQVAWTPIAGTRLYARIMRDDVQAWVQLAPGTTVHGARTIIVNDVSVPGITLALQDLIHQAAFDDATLEGQPCAV